MTKNGEMEKSQKPLPIVIPRRSFILNPSDKFESLVLKIIKKGVLND